MPSEFKLGDLVVHHYCGGSVYGRVVKVNAKSVQILCTGYEDGQLLTYRKNEVSHTDREYEPAFERTQR